MSHLKDVVNTPLSRKRARSDSSPTFDEFSPIGIDDLEALCGIEAKMNQTSSPLAKKRKCSPTPSPRGKPRPLDLLKENKPVGTAVASSSSKPASKRASPKLQPTPVASHAKAAEPEYDEYDDEFGPEPGHEDAFDSWFQPAPSDVPAFVSFVRPSAGPTKQMKIIQPSAAALKAAEKLLAAVEDEEDKTADTPAPAKKPPPPFVAPKLPTVPKLKEEPQEKVTPGPSQLAPKSSQPVAPIVDPKLQTAFATPARPPLSQPASRLPDPTPSVDTKPVLQETPARKPVASAIIESPAVVPKHLGMRSRPRGSLKAKFATPWKQGATPSTQTPTAPQVYPSRVEPSTPTPSTSKPAKAPEVKRIIRDANTVFDLNLPLSRQKLRNLSISKHRSIDALIELGIPAEVGDIDSWNATYWAFEEDGVKQDVNTAFDALKKAGCSLLTKPWLENHWTQIVWKLANMAVLWPEAQSERWCYQEVLNQLLYRYEREINRCQRPAIRLIQERDASPNAAMILCVFEISWPSESRSEKAAPVLVLTDGWYKIRAQVDVALVRAIKKRRIRVGSKLEIVGARLDAQRKDADDVLKSFESSSLIISGNSTHLAPWHAKLGFQQLPSAATLNSLVPDGGVVPMMFVTIVNAFPLAFIESCDGGERESRSEAEEQAARDAWERKRESEAAKLREEICNRLEKMKGFVERLQGIAGSAMSRISDDAMPDDIDSKVEDLEESEDPKSMLKTISPVTAAWMASLLNAKILKQHEDMAGEITSELEASFPARNVRSCRVLLVRDAVNQKKKGLRVAQITVWDAEALGKETLVEGKTYMVTNLFPQIPNAWGKPGAEGQVFLVTRRDTRWKKVTNQKL